MNDRYVDFVIYDKIDSTRAVCIGDIHALGLRGKCKLSVCILLECFLVNVLFPHLVPSTIEK